MKVMAKENLVSQARNLGVRASQHTAKVINQVHTQIEKYEKYNRKNKVGDAIAISNLKLSLIVSMTDPLTDRVRC